MLRPGSRVAVFGATALVVLSLAAGCAGPRSEPAPAAQTAQAVAEPAAPTEPRPVSTADAPRPDCEWCGAREAPAALDAALRIAPDGEDGDVLVLQGTVRHADGRPASDAVLYLYHTNAQGRYARRGNERGNGRRHGYLRGWLRPDARGRYQVTTVRPGSYPSGSQPAHVHVTVLEDGVEYYLEDFVFADDPKLDTHRERASGIGGSGIVSLRQAPDGGWHGIRDIVLPASPPSSAR